MTRKELEDLVTSYLDSCSTMTLACALEGAPWAADVYFVRLGLDLVFFSSGRSRHATVLAGNPRAAVTVHREYRNWREIKGLQMEGYVELVPLGPGQARALAAYIQKFPFSKDFFSDPLAISATVFRKMLNVAVHVFKPQTILYIDNERGFGKRWRFRVENGMATGDAEVLESWTP